MSKSIVLNQNWENATNSETKLELGDDILNVLRPQIEKRKDEFPVIWRIVEDFYNDFKIDTFELKSLTEEIQQLLGNSANKIELTIWLEILKALTELGISYNLALFGIAD